MRRNKIEETGIKHQKSKPGRKKASKYTSMEVPPIPEGETLD